MLPIRMGQKWGSVVGNGACPGSSCPETAVSFLSLETNERRMRGRGGERNLAETTNMTTLYRLGAAVLFCSAKLNIR